MRRSTKRATWRVGEAYGPINRLRRRARARRLRNEIKKMLLEARTVTDERQPSTR